MANFRDYTRYTAGRIAENRSGEKFLALRKPLNLQEADDDVLVQITQDLVDRPDLVASKAYDNPDLWWVIYEFNGIQNPLEDLNIGDILRVPDISRVIDAIDKLEGETSGGL